MLNEYPDIDADRAFGRRNMPILYGTKNSGIVYLVFKLSAAAAILSGILFGLLPVSSLASMALLVGALPIALMTAAWLGEQKKLILLMATHVGLALAVPVVLPVSMMTE